MTSKKTTERRKPSSSESPRSTREKPAGRDRHTRVSKSIDKVLTKHADTMAKLAR